MASPFSFDGTWQFTVSPVELWTTLAQTHRYPEWWPWLRSLDPREPELTAGAEARAVIQAPLPYQLRCAIRVEEVVQHQLLATTVSGDLAGPATLELRTTAQGTEARLAWSLDLQAPVLRSLALVARPAMKWAHDRIVERGLAQFEERALRERDG